MRRNNIKLGPIILANLIFFQSILPYQSFALTGGPSQPEVQSFEPISTNQMVDPFTGDFTYNIPLLNVPGPNGGYPINLAYHAGVGMEEEASWTGLGWNLNPGVLTRGLRGLPDDFKGDNIVKKRYTKPNITIAAGGAFSLSGEVIVYGDLAKSELNAGASLGIRYNNYRGIDVTSGLNASFNAFGIVGVGVGLSHDTEHGTSITPNVSLTKNFDEISASAGMSLSKTFHSRQGSLPTNFGISTERSIKTHNDGKRKYRTSSSNSGSISLNSFSTYLPSSSFETSTNSFKGAFEAGFSVGVAVAKVDVWASKSKTAILNKTKTHKSYGYLYSEFAGDNDLLDFNRENDGNIHHDSPRLPIPIFTNDIFNASGNGIGGSFKAFRNDVGILGDPVTVSSSSSVEASVEKGFGVGVHVGVDANFGKGKIKEGKLQGYSELFNSKGYGFKTEEFKKEHPHFKPYFFKNLSELSASEGFDNTSIKDISSYSKTQKGSTGIFTIPNQEDFAVNDVLNVGSSVSNSFLNRKEYVGDAMSVKSVRELKAARNRTGYHSYLYPSSGEVDKWDESSLPLEENGHLIGEVSVINQSGMKYVYGLPAINHRTSSYAFTIDEISNEIDKTKKTVKYYPSSQGESRKIGNGKGKDEFYEETEVPAYAHSFHLTNIFSIYHGCKHSYINYNHN